MGVTEINLLGSLPHAGQAVPATLHEAAVEFDTMVWSIVLRESGMLRAFGADEGGEAGLLGDLFLHNLARELAAQMDIGFGRAALDVATVTHKDGVKK